MWASAGSQPRSWDDECIARDLEAWFATRAFQRWPSYRTFIGDGRKHLYNAVIDRGDPERSAPELTSRTSPPLRAEDLPAIRRTPRDASGCASTTQCASPRSRGSSAHGPPSLAAAVSRHGGSSYWTAVLHMPPPPPARWTDELIEAELRRICRYATHWPSKADFEAAGSTGLLGAVSAGHASRWWAERLGLSGDGHRARRQADSSGEA